MEDWHFGYNEYKLFVSVHVSVCEELLSQLQSCLHQGHLNAVIVAMVTYTCCTMSVPVRCRC